MILFPLKKDDVQSNLRWVGKATKTSYTFSNFMNMEQKTHLIPDHEAFSNNTNNLEHPLNHQKHRFSSHFFLFKEFLGTR